MSDSNPTGFAGLGLPFPVLRVLEELGYETPSAIQANSIPPLLEGRDVLGMAQTGTGKTAAFALPLLVRTNADFRSPQVLVLAPTRELAKQVAEADKSYSRYLNGINVCAIYGGADYGSQLRELKRGPQWVVGTPGRVMDHLRRGTLSLADIKAVVLDEADEMLRMGFIDDVNWILDQAPAQRQIALFSATMPKEIQTVAEKHLRDPVQVKIETKTTTNDRIHQRYWFVAGAHKNDALLRIAETEEFDAMMVFVRTKQATEEVADYMLSQGFRAAPLNGDIPQQQRERAVEKLKQGQLDILVATDVAARGLDVERISHVINYDIPHDTESYVHRIGRTGRAGREGEAIVFVRAREKRMLRDIEKATRQPIEEMELPSVKQVNDKRRVRFEARILDALNSPQNALYKEMITHILAQQPVDAIDVAAACARLIQGDKSLFLSEQDERRERKPRERNDDRGERRERSERAPRGREAGRDERSSSRKSRPDFHPLPLKGNPDVEMVRYMVAVGYDHGMRPGNLVGAVANEADLESRYIGHIEIMDHYSVIDLPSGMPSAVLNTLKKARVCGQPLDIQVYKESAVPEKAAGTARAPSARPPRARAPRDSGYKDGGFKKPRKKESRG